jgi:hypothetical protein
MLKIRKKREARRDALAAERLAQVEASVVRLADEDLLNLADIFKEAPDCIGSSHPEALQ